MPKQEWISYTGYVRRPTSTDVFTAATQRIEDAFNNLPDPIFVSFSGGKDSTVVLMLSLAAARKFDRLPLKVITVDEEVIDPDTTAYIEDVGSWPDVELHHICHPIQHTYRSEVRSHWYPWNPAYKNVWARDMPEKGIQLWDTRLGDGIKNGYVDLIGAYAMDTLGYPSFTTLSGIRTQESINRLRAMFTSGKHTIVRGPETYLKPIYDWSWKDVWHAIRIHGWQYSQFYEKAHMVGKSFHKTRVAVWGNVSSMSDVKFFQAFYPDFWERAIKRLPEMATFAKHAQSELFTVKLPPGMTYREYTFLLLSAMEDPESKAFWEKQIELYIGRWLARSSEPLPDEPILTTSGYLTSNSWKNLANAMARNDLIKDSDTGALGCRDLN